MKLKQALALRVKNWLPRSLILLHLIGCFREEFSRSSLLGLAAQSLLDKATGFDATTAVETFGFNGRVTFTVDGDLDSLIQAAPPT